MPAHQESSFNTQPPEGGWAEEVFGFGIYKVSTHSRPKAAGEEAIEDDHYYTRFNTQPPEGGWHYFQFLHFHQHLFQHTAARRRLGGKMFWLL